MFYTVIAAANVTGLSKSTLLGAIETGQITAAKNLLGEWEIKDSDLHRLCSAVREGAIGIDAPSQYASTDQTNIEAEIADLVQGAGDSLRQSLDEKPHEPADEYQRLELSSLLTGVTPWSAASAPRREGVGSQLRSRIIVISSAAAVTVCLCWIASQSLFLRVTASTTVEKDVKSSLPLANSEDEKIGANPTENNADTKSSSQSTRKLANATRLTRADDSPRSANAVIPTPANPKSSSIGQAKSTSPKVVAGEAPRKISPRPNSVPETRPTTIQGWTIREVVGDKVILAGPNGIWKVARGDTVPGLGKVDSIVRWGNRWIVATSKGLISTP